MFSAETFGVALGLALALGVFAFKTAVGEYYFCALPGKPLLKAVFLCVTLGLYGGIFAAAFCILARVDLFRLAGSAVAFLKAGTLFHLLLSAGLLIWGTQLLRRGTDEKPGKGLSRGWLLLALPCPVCVSAIFLASAFALMLFPRHGELLRRLVPGFFLGANLLFLLLLSAAGKVLRIPPLKLAGHMMILIGLYFILILSIAPRFQDAEKLYAAACSTGNGLVFSPALFLAAALPAAAGAAGFIWGLLSRKGY